MKITTKIKYLLCLIHISACIGNSNKDLQQSTPVYGFEAIDYQILVDSLKNDLTHHKFKSFENKLIKSNLCVIKNIKNRKYLVPIVELDDELRYLVFKYYLLFAYDDYISGIQTLDLFGYHPSMVQYNDKLGLGYRNMKNILYSNENLGDIRNDWNEIKLLKIQNPKDVFIDFMYFISKSALVQYSPDKTLVSDTLSRSDFLYLNEKAFSDDSNHLDYLRILIKALETNKDTTTIDRLKILYSKQVQEYYDFSITENFHFGESSSLKLDEIKKIWKNGNFKDSLVGNLIYLNQLLQQKEYNDVVQKSNKLCEQLLLNYDDNRFMIDYRNSLIKYSALALFLQSKFREYYKYIETMKFELKGYDLDEKRNFEKFTKEFYLKYYKGDSEFSKILRDCYS